MYGKLTMLAVAGVMALSGCGNSGRYWNSGGAKGETTALAGTETEKALEEASQGRSRPLGGRIFLPTPAISGPWIPRWEWILRLQR
ncbi:MAG: hypothetical protein ACLVK1_08400 [Lachnospiraceae bacterium]